MQDAAFDDSVILVGTAGWSYDDWAGIVYPKTMPRGAHPLEWLSAWFDMVEINASFYRPMQARHAEAWVRRVAQRPNFRFTAKLWRRFTHERDAWPTAPETTAYVDGLEPLHEAGRLGAVLAQFPWSFRRTADNRMWLARLTDAFSAYPLAIELRHTSWMQPSLLDGLCERNVAFCNIDQPLLDECIAPAEHVTATVGYVRLHGRRADTWFAEGLPSYERYNYLYSEEELEPWVARVRRMAGATERLYVATNNHYQGQAVVNALEILHALGRPTPELPPYLLDAYPRLRNIVGK